MIKLALETVQLVILRLQVEAMSNKTVARQEYYQLLRVRDLLAECNTTVALQ
jgi:hypothetical protein